MRIIDFHSPTFVWLVVLSAFGFCCHADPLIEAITSQVHSEKAGAASQQRVDKLDDESRQMVQEYRESTLAIQDLEPYVAQMERLIADQKSEIEEKQHELEEIEIVKRRIFPFLLQMVDTLEQYVGLDAPFLREERENRVTQLRELMNRSDIQLAEKYRRAMEAYRIEAGYGHHVEAYQGPLDIDDKHLTVQFLRVGRVGLYYLSFDGQQAGAWDRQNHRWISLGSEFREPLEEAFRIARKQAPPNLIRLPVSTPETSS